MKKWEDLATLAQFPTWLKLAAAWKQKLLPERTQPPGCHDPITPDCLLATKAKDLEREIKEMPAKHISLLSEQAWCTILLPVPLN